MPKYPKERDVVDELQFNELLSKTPNLPPPPECYRQGWCIPHGGGWWQFDATQDATIEQQKLWMAEVRAWRRACFAILVRVQVPERHIVH